MIESQGLGTFRMGNGTFGVKKNFKRTYINLKFLKADLALFFQSAGLVLSIKCLYGKVALCFLSKLVMLGMFFCLWNQKIVRGQ